jgi:hypothetical protein
MPENTRSRVSDALAPSTDGRRSVADTGGRIAAPHDTAV